MIYLPDGNILHQCEFACSFETRRYVSNLIIYIILYIYYTYTVLFEYIYIYVYVTFFVVYSIVFSNNKMIYFAVC